MTGLTSLLAGGLSCSLSLFLGEDLVGGSNSRTELTVLLALLFTGGLITSGLKVRGTILRPLALITSSSWEITEPVVPAMQASSVLAENIILSVMSCGLSPDILLAWTSSRALAVCLVVGLSIMTQCRLESTSATPTCPARDSFGGKCWGVRTNERAALR